MELTYTTFTIGGKVPPNKWPEFRELITEYFDVQGVVDDPHALLDGALEDKKAFVISEQLNFGGADELEYACRQWGITYHKSWDAKSGVFDAGLEFWKPGMERPEERDATNENGEPAFGLQALKNRLAEGKTLQQVVDELDRFDPRHVPPIGLGTEPWEEPPERTTVDDDEIPF